MGFPYHWIPGPRIPGSVDSNIPGPLYLRIPGSPDSKIPGSLDSKVPVSLDSKIPGSLNPKIPGSLGSNFHGSLFTKHQNDGGFCLRAARRRARPHIVSVVSTICSLVRAHDRKIAHDVRACVHLDSQGFQGDLKVGSAVVGGDASHAFAWLVTHG